MVTTFDHIRPSDGERVGTIEITDDGLFVPYDLLGRRQGEPGDLDVAEAVLDEIGLRSLAESWVLRTDGEADLDVRIVEVHPDHLVVAPLATDDNVALAVDLTRRTRLPLPTDRLTER